MMIKFGDDADNCLSAASVKSFDDWVKVYINAERNKFVSPTEDPTKTAYEIMIADRGKTHGKFENTSKLSQELKQTVAFWTERPTCRITEQQHEAIDLILMKIARIVIGDNSFQDHWDDIAGYAKIGNKDYHAE